MIMYIRGTRYYNHFRGPATHAEAAASALRISDKIGHYFTRHLTAGLPVKQAILSRPLSPRCGRAELHLPDINRAPLLLTGLPMGV